MLEHGCQLVNGGLCWLKSGCHHKGYWLIPRGELSWAAGQFVMSGFLDFKMAPWKRSCVTRTVAIVPTLIIAVVFQASHKLDQLNQLLNILQSIMLPFAIIPVSSVVIPVSLCGLTFAKCLLV